MTEPPGPDRSGPDELDRRVAGLVGRADQCDADRSALHTFTQELAGMVTELAQTTAVRTTPPMSWLDPGTWPDNPDHAGVLAELTAWVGQVYLRYSGAVLPSCWLCHPGLVEELLVLWRLWVDAHAPKTGSWQRAAEWHQVYRPGVVRRLKESPAGTCDLVKHTTTGLPDDCAGEPAPLSRWAAEIADAWANHGISPTPTAEMLADTELHIIRSEH